MAGRFAAWLSGPPRDAAAFGELDDVVLPDVAVRGRHGEDVADSADSLAGSGLGQVVVAVPAWLLGRIGNQLEDLVGAAADLAAGTDHTWNLVVARHLPIESPGANANQNRLVREGSHGRPGDAAHPAVARCAAYDEHSGGEFLEGAAASLLAE